MIKIGIINRNVPPYKGATGFHAAKLAQHLLSTGFYNIQVTTIGTGRHEEDGIQVNTVSSVYSGRNKTIRLLSSGLESYRLVKKALSYDADFYIVLTDPPLLNYWAARLLKKENWALWTMDLYPQGFVAGGLVAKSDFKTRKYLKILQAFPPSFLITLGTAQRQFLEPIFPTNIKSIEIPIGFRDRNIEQKGIPPRWAQKDKIILGYIGNLSEAHDPQLIKLISTAIDINRIHLVVACYGAHADLLKQSLKEVQGVSIVDKVKEEDLVFIDVHIVSLLEKWTHICVPSKALTGLELGAATLFVGSNKSDTWSFIDQAGWHINGLEEIPNWLSKVSLEEVNNKKLFAIKQSALLKRTLLKRWHQIDETIRSFVKRGKKNL